MQNLALFVFTELDNDGVQQVTYPANRSMLFRNLGSLIEPISLSEQLLRFLEPVCPVWDLL